MIPRIPKQNASLHKICIAAIKRHTRVDFVHEFQWTKYYESANGFEEDALLLAIELKNNELIICSTIISIEHWSVLTTQRIITKLEGERIEGNMSIATGRSMGKLVDQKETIITAKVHFLKHQQVPFIYENGKASMVMIYGIQTLIQILSKEK